MLKERKLSERREPLNFLKRLCALLIKKSILLKILQEEEVDEEEEEDISEAGGGRHSQGEKADLHCICCKRNGSHAASTCKLPWEKIEQKINQQKGKTDDTNKGKAPESAHYIEAQFNIGVNEDLFNASLASSKK